MGYLESLSFIFERYLLLVQLNAFYRGNYCLRQFYAFTWEFWMYITKDFILNAHNEILYSTFLNIFSFDNDVIPFAPLPVSYCSLV